MSFFDFFNRFWDYCAMEPYSITEVALYHYLLNIANRNRFVMPIKCSTSLISVHLKTSKQNVIKAREGLTSRGLILFESGTGRDSAASYQLLCGERVTQLEKQPPESERTLSHELSDTLSSSLTDSNINKYKRNDYNKRKPVSSSRRSSGRSILVPVTFS